MDILKNKAKKVALSKKIQSSGTKSRSAKHLDYTNKEGKDIRDFNYDAPQP